MKKLLLIVSVLSICQFAKAQIEASNLPSATLGTNENLIGIHNTLASQTTMPNLGPVIAPFIPFGSLGGILPATASLTNGANIGWKIVSTNVTTTPSGNTQTNYLIQPYMTNGVTLIITNMWSPTLTNRLYVTNGIIMNITSP